MASLDPCRIHPDILSAGAVLGASGVVLGFVFCEDKIDHAQERASTGPPSGEGRRVSANRGLNERQRRNTKGFVIM